MPFRIALLALLFVVGACDRPNPSGGAAPSSPAPVTPAPASALIGQWRNARGTWRFQANGTFWFMGGTTIQANLPPGLNVPRTEQFHGTYEIRGAKLHLTLQQRKPVERDSAFQIDGRKLTIDGTVYDRQ
jgi:hypothetical protein